MTSVGAGPPAGSAMSRVARPVRTTLDPTAAQLWQAARGPLAVLVLVLLAGLALAAVAGGKPTGLLDPRAADPSGSRAVASLLRDQGVTVDLVRTSAAMQASAHAGDTLFVAAPDLLVASQARLVRDSGADLVLAGTGSPERFVRGVTLRGGSGSGTRAPGCALPAASRAGTADAGVLAYSVDATKAGVAAGTQIEECYSAGGDPSLVHTLAGDGRSVTLLGNAEPLTNDHLAEHGNAALALGLLGARGRLVWYLPTLGDLPPGGQRSIYDLVPTGVWWALVQLAIAVLLVAVWRGRRLGAVVPEPLPVVVRATETVEGRGRLYRRSGAREAAANGLRSAALGRLLPALGLPRVSDAVTVAESVAARSRLTSVEVGALLYGAAPADDGALVRLAGLLDDLEKEVGRP
jgi:Domain of unknown function (DUF4350)